MIKSVTLISVFVVGCILIGYFSVLHFTRKVEMATKEIHEVQVKYKSLETEYFYLVKQLVLKLDSSKILTNENSSQLSIGHLTGKPYVIVRLHETNCIDCIQTEKAKLEQLATKIGKNRIIVFGRFSSIRNLKLFKQRVGLTFATYIIEDIGIENNEDIDYVNKPFIFILSSGNLISNLYFPGTFDVTYSKDEYYKILESIFLSRQ